MLGEARGAVLRAPASSHRSAGDTPPIAAATNAPVPRAREPSARAPARAAPASVFTSYRACAVIWPRPHEAGAVSRLRTSP